MNRNIEKKECRVCGKICPIPSWVCCSEECYKEYTKRIQKVYREKYKRLALKNGSDKISKVVIGKPRIKS